MNIWLINHYAVPTKYYPLARPENYARFLIAKGHNVTIFAASTVHNSNINLIDDGSLYREEFVDGIHYVYIRDCDYADNVKKRIINMFLFPNRLPKVCKHFDKPDVIISVSATPMACTMGLKLAKKYKCKGIAEVADLWPESFVAYGLIGEKNLMLKPMYAYEHRMYHKADAIIFTMEGGKDYLIQKKWDKANGGNIDLKKVYHINNGVDLAKFDNDVLCNPIKDEDLSNNELFKVIYTGAIRKANDLSILLEVSAKIDESGKKIVLLIYGDGEDRKHLEQEAKARKLKSIIFKGRIDKNQVPYVLSKADVCLLHWKPTPITKFGMSMNKSFEYLASGKPIISNSISGYDLIKKYDCGITADVSDANEYVNNIVRISDATEDEYQRMCDNSRKAAQEYDFKKLTDRLLTIIEGA